MTMDKLKSVFAHYRVKLEEMFPGLEPRQMDEAATKQLVDELPIEVAGAHFKFMCDEAQRFVDAGRIEKAMRWLGFLQGVFWSIIVYNLDDLKRHSTPDKTE